MTVKFKACPKCHGDLQIKRDIYGLFVSCLQCGLQQDLDAPSAAVEAAKPAQTPMPQPAQELLQAA